MTEQKQKSVEFPPSVEVSEAKRKFIRELARFLVDQQVGKGVQLNLHNEPGIKAWAEEWARLRRTTPIFGYPTVEDAEKTLAEFLG